MRFFRGTLPYCIIAVLGLFLAGCHRPASDSVAKALINLPASVNQSIQSAGQDLTHVVINVTGDSMLPIFYDWDSCRNCLTAQAAPSAFEVDIPKGQNRLIQVIAVYKNSTSNSMDIYYGDVTTSLSDPTATVTVNVTSVAASTVISGRVMGRYFTTASQGPTGILRAFFDPGNGKPKMLVDSNQMINGWFNTMVLSGISLSYHVINETTDIDLWNGPVSLESSVFSTSNFVTKAGIPVNVRQEHSGNGVASFDENDATIYIWGFFGASGVTASKFVCVDTTMPLQNLRIYTPSSGAYATQPTLGVTTGTVPSATALANTSTPLSSIYFSGGVASGTAPCSTASPSDLFTNELKVTMALIDGNGNDNAAGFRVPFIPPTTYSFISVDTSSPRNITGKLLPDIASVIDNISIYKRSSSLLSYIEAPDCDAIAIDPNFALAGSGAVNPTSGAFTINTNISSSEANAGVSGVLCFSLAGKLHHQGVFVQAGDLMFGTPVAADNFILNTDASQMGVSQCHPLRLYLTGGGSGRTYSDVDQNFTISLSGFSQPSQFLFYTDNTCSTQLASQSTYGLPAGQTTATLYMQGTYPEPGAGTITFTNSPMGKMASQTFTITNSSIATQLEIPSTLTLAKGQCMDVSAVLTDGSHTTASAGASSNYTVIVPSGLALVTSCNQPTPVSGSSFTIPSGGYSFSFGLVNIGNGSGTLNISGPFNAQAQVN
jgi:hypothetical protein